MPSLIAGVREDQREINEASVRIPVKLQFGKRCSDRQDLPDVSVPIVQ